MRHYLYLIILALGFSGCTKAPTQEELERREAEAAKAAAKESYDLLMAGDYDRFVESRADASMMPASYREQIAIACRQTMAQQVEAHAGIISYEISNARIDSTQNVMLVFLKLNYADETQEEIVVPMVKREGNWKIK